MGDGDRSSAFRTFDRPSSQVIPCIELLLTLALNANRHGYLSGRSACSGVGADSKGSGHFCLEKHDSQLFLQHSVKLTAERG